MTRKLPFGLVPFTLVPPPDLTVLPYDPAEEQDVWEEDDEEDGEGEEDDEDDEDEDEDDDPEWIV